jgi:hypothetical protein
MKRVRAETPLYVLFDFLSERLGAGTSGDSYLSFSPGLVQSDPDHQYQKYWVERDQFLYIANIFKMQDFWF